MRSISLWWIISCFFLQVQNATSFSQARGQQRGIGLQISKGESQRNSALYAARQEAQERRKAESVELGHHPLISLNLNLDSLARGGAASRAQELLERIEALYEEGYYAVSPDVVSYNSVLNAWAKRNSPEKALELLQTLEEKRDRNDQSGKSDSIHTNVISYNTVIYAFAQNGFYKEAEQLLRHMQQNTDGSLVPDTVSFNSVLYAHAKSSEKDAPARAEALLREMMTEENEAQVDVSSFNICLYAWANSKHPRAPHRAQELLDHMEVLSTAGNAKVRPDVYSYSTVIQAWVSQLRNQHRRRENLRRGLNFDNNQLKAHQDKDTAACRAAKALLKKMEDQQLLPNQVTYTSVMAALCWSGKPQEAHELLINLLKRFEQQDAIVGESSSAASMLVKPDTVAFSAVMDGWVKNANNFPDAADRVMELFQLMKHWQAKGHDDMGPNSRTYTSVLSALAKSRTWEACLYAKDLLKEIPDEGPSIIHYNAVLDAFAKSPRADKARHAKALLDEMTGSKMNSEGGALVSPDVITYNTILSCCAGSFGNAELRQESLATATSIFKHICQSEELDPTPYTFSLMIKALRKLVGEEKARNAFIGKVFKLCCQHKRLNASVWQQMKKAVPQDKDNEILWKELLGDDLYKPGVLLSDLPKAWKCSN